MCEAREGSSRGLAARERAEGSKFKGLDWSKHLDGRYLMMNVYSKFMLSGDWGCGDIRKDFNVLWEVTVECPICNA